MVENKLYYQKRIEMLINMNPVLISISREEISDDGYGGTTADITYVDEVVTFYNNKASVNIINDYGITHGTHAGTSVSKLLATGDANILRGDTFTHNGIEYRVAFVNDYLGICKQIELEVIR